MSSGLYSGVSGLALGFGLYKGFSGLWSGASGFDAGVFPSLNLDFLTNTTLDPRITFSRTTNATLVDSTGRVTYAPNNLVVRSEEFENAAWSKTNSTIAANVTAAPNGTLTADKHIPDAGVTMGTGATETRVQRSPTATIGVNYVFSIYAKASEYDQIELALVATPSVSARFSLTLGTVLSGTGATITDVGNGWYRCALPALAGATGALGVRWSAKSSTVLVGDGTSGIFAWGAQFEEVTYQTTPGTYNQTVASVYYGPRFDYNPATLAPRGLLIEEQRVNLLLYSEQFDNAGWTKTRSSITANATTSPDGTANADRFVIDTTAATNHPVGQSASVTSGTTYALTVFAKADQFSQINLRFSAQFPAGNAYYDLNSGTVSSSGTVVSASMTSFGNGWWRCVLVMTANATGAAAGQIFLAQSNSITIATADGTSGLFLWGAQLEAGAFATGYIPTVASTVTRAADLAVMTGSNFSSWYNASEGTYVVSADSFRGTAGAGRISQFDDGTTANNIRSGQSTLQVVDATIVQVNIAGTPLIPFDGTVFQFASAYKLNDFATVTTGAVATDTSGTVPTVNQLVLGSGGSISPTTFINGHIRTFTYYPQRLANTQLQELAAPPLVASLSLDFINGTYQA
jgi:hypothetical protein